MSEKESLEFVELVRCEDPMESELLPAALREKDIPHRTERDEDGNLILLVAAEWKQEAQEAVDKARDVFFGGLGKDEPASQTVGLQASLRYEGQEQDVDGGFGLFALDAMPTPEETRHKAIWPAYVMAGLPGLGLGHLYAGKFQIFFYLFFCSLLGLLFFHFTDSYWSFAFNVFAWGVDLGFASFHVREHNRKAERARRRLTEMEQEFRFSAEGKKP